MEIGVRGIFMLHFQASGLRLGFRSIYPVGFITVENSGRMAHGRQYFTA
jgi:hypothetical protein